MNFSQRLDHLAPYPFVAISRPRKEAQREAV